MYFKLYFIGFDSYVGEVLRVLKPEGLVDLKYKYCGTGHDKYFRGAFTPGMFFNLTRINKTQYYVLQLPAVHDTFDPRETASHKVEENA